MTPTSSADLKAWENAAANRSVPVTHPGTVQVTLRLLTGIGPTLQVEKQTLGRSGTHMALITLVGPHEFNRSTQARIRTRIRLQGSAISHIQVPLPTLSVVSDWKGLGLGSESLHGYPFENQLFWVHCDLPSPRLVLLWAPEGLFPQVIASGHWFSPPQEGPLVPVVPISLKPILNASAWPAQPVL